MIFFFLLFLLYEYLFNTGFGRYGLYTFGRIMW